MYKETGEKSVGKTRPRNGTVRQGHAVIILHMFRKVNRVLLKHPRYRTLNMC